MRIRISYPSGYVFEVEGDWKGPQPMGEDNSEGIAPVIEITGDTMSFHGHVGEYLVADPRAVVQAAADSTVLYNPRHPLFLLGLGKTFLEWMVENPEWPNVLELQGLPKGDYPDLGEAEGDAPGAMPRGTLIEKTNTEEGDAHPDGHKGVVQGSMRDGPALAYCVEWEGLPGVPVWIDQARIRAR